MIICSAIPGKAVCKLVWNMNRETNTRHLERALAGIPADFTGNLLEVPVSTGVLTMPVYKMLPRADITTNDRCEMLGCVCFGAENGSWSMVTQPVPAPSIG